MDSTRARSHIYVGFVYRSYLRNICTPPSHYRYTTKIANKPALCIPNSPIGKRYSTWKYREKIYNDYEDCIIWYNSKSKPQRRSDTIVTRTRTRYQIRTQIYLQPTLPRPCLLSDIPSNVIRPHRRQELKVSLQGHHACPRPDSDLHSHERYPAYSTYTQPNPGFFNRFSLSLLNYRKEKKNNALISSRHCRPHHHGILIDTNLPVL